MQDILQKSKSSLDLAGLRRLAEGSLAAPEGEDADAWMGLVAPALTEAMKAELRNYRSKLASDMPYSHGSAGWVRGRVEALRAELLRRDIAGFICPRSDEHQGEYVAPCAERLSWLTGFTGSAGLAIVLAGRAAIFVDGRYTLQVRSQVDCDVFEPLHATEAPPSGWLAAHAPRGGRIGFDPRLHTPEGLARLREGAARAGAELVALEDDPLDAIWA
ncbi:MAG: aminopeptidase P family N-terminal domain-containing protein, partial [Alphaproteobacteria bacterium]